jgi:hypothetical protein
MSPFISLIFALAVLCFIAFVFCIALLPVWRAALLHRRLMRTGAEADAVVLSISQTGGYVNKRPIVRLQVQVHPEAARSYIAELRYSIDYAQIPQLGCGSQIRLKYNPANPKQVALVGPAYRKQSDHRHLQNGV